MASRMISSFNALQGNGQSSNRPVIDLDTSGLRLSAADEQKAFEFFGWIEEKAAAAQAKRDQEALEARRGPFNFLGLPAELRIRVYRFAARNSNNSHEIDDGVNLSNHVIPPLVYVNRQVQQESVPVFYGKTKFFVNINSNLIDWCTRRGVGPSPAAMPSRQARAGTLGIKRQLKKTIRRLGNAVLIRDITFKIFDTEYGRLHRRNAPDSEVVSTIRFQTGPKTGGGNLLNKNVSPGKWHPDNAARFPNNSFPGFFDVEDIDTATQNAVQEAKDIEEEPGFHGLTLDALASIAIEYRST